MKTAINLTIQIPLARKAALAGGFGLLASPTVYGMRRNCTLLLSVPSSVVTVTVPVVAPAGTVAIM